MKIKKLLVLILSIITIIMGVCFTGCQPESQVANRLGDRFGYVQESGEWSWIVYDKETKVMYLCVRSGNGGIGITVLVDENGKPLLYNGD